MMENHETGEAHHENPDEAPSSDGGATHPEAGVFSRDERQWAMFCHLSTLAGFIIPFGNIVGPLVIWMTKREESALVNDQGKEAINFQISMTLYTIVAAISIMCFVGIVLLPALVIADIVFTIIACMKANEGVYYRYPMTIRLVN